MNRRGFLLGGAALAAAATRASGLGTNAAHDHGAGMLAMNQEQSPQGQGQDAGRLYNPNVVQQRTRSTDYDNDEYIKNIEKQLGCTCGCNLDIYTCRTTDFTCATSPRLHREVVALHEAGSSADEILESFMATYGDEILMAPKPEGFNLAGYLVPGILITLVAGALTTVLVRRQRVLQAAGATLGAQDAPAPSIGATPEELERLQQALRDADG
jgi:cytochrome c-type biogenesis protein CcmH/NrfF